MQKGAVVTWTLRGIVLSTSEVTKPAIYTSTETLDIPAVVLFGGHTSPETTGYKDHINVYPEHDKSPCGQWQECDHCKEVMEMITVESVVDSVWALVGNGIHK